MAVDPLLVSKVDLIKGALPILEEAMHFQVLLGGGEVILDSHVASVVAGLKVEIAHLKANL